MSDVEKSLILEKLNWRFLWRTLSFILLFIAVAEVLFRLDAVQAIFTGPRIGSRHRQFEIQVARLEKLRQDGVPIDCIFLGNSMIWLGVDPLIVAQTFEAETGQALHCFNFGVSALPASSAGQVAQMLVNRYQPQVLIYGTFARDYAIPADAEDAYVISDTPWLHYLNGDFNLNGWLFTHSKVFQYRGHLRDLLFMNYLEDVFVPRNVPVYQAYGLDPKEDIRVDVRTAPDFETRDNRDPVKWLGQFSIKPEGLEGLRTITQLTNAVTQVVVVELPFYETALDFFPNGQQDYDAYIQKVDEITAASQTPFWRVDETLFLPPETWWDYFHLNLKGVEVFSTWLGDRLAADYLEGGANTFSAYAP